MRERAEQVAARVEEVRARLAPDARLGVCEVVVEEREGDALALVGVTSEAEVDDALRGLAAGLDGWSAVQYEVRRLPEGDADELVHGLVRAAVAPMLAGPRVTETQVSQVVLGNRLLVLRSDGRWLQCKSPDGYVGWVHAGYVALMGEIEAKAWEAGIGGDVWISLGAEVRGEGGEALVRLPWGARVVREPSGRARLPDGRLGEPDGELLPAAARPIAFPAEGTAICETGARWLGAPYLWSGVTMGGVDCSGFVQAVFRMHGVPLPRDSDQQGRAGEHVDPGEDFEDLRPGDLLFFAEEGGRCTHVAMSTGGSQVIHASLGNGGVARNDLAGRRSYERELARLFLFARRYL
ncbi:MAG TPA: C40 family peptidase [Longimicrobiaceae bacterium]|nr:C40 family peptidase [Longimicrobiaceae bacterium]